MNLRTHLALIAGQITRKAVLKLKKGNGEAAPGLLALKLDPDFISHLHETIPIKILITGTNGKTTTTNLISTILKNANFSFITNSSGSNLERGLASKLIVENKKISTVLWETDEAAFIPIAEKVKPSHILITNLFRDQLDRYGEINTTLDKWLNCLSNLPQSHIILNADDPSLAFLGKKLEKKHHVFYFGLKTQSNNLKLKHSADAIFCPNCSKYLKYKNITFSHLGEYSCKCKFTKPKLDFTASKIETSFNKSLFSINNKNYQTNLIGLYNIYNCLAAFSLATKLNIDKDTIKNTIDNFKAVKGRQEIIEINDKVIQLWLVKNPTGFDQVIDSLELINKKLTICIALNDNLADGRDVSWIWDVDFEKLTNFSRKIILTGDRVYDLALRLKYADMEENKLVIFTDKEKAINYLLKEKVNNLFILPTYTALWELRNLLLNQIKNEK